MLLTELHKIYMLGIGGIGMSALARYFHLKGVEVSGYDKTETELTKSLLAEGIFLTYEFDVTAVQDIDLLIYTPAVPMDNPIIEKAIELNVPIKKRAEVLGLISRSYKTIAIAGTHGKTTTSAMVTHLMRESGIDCTGFIGGIIRNFNSNFVFGESEWVVIEADEYDRSFLQLNPEIAVITSMDPDHLDVYGTREQVTAGFHEFAQKLNPGGQLFLNDRLFSFTQAFSSNALFYGLAGKDCYAENINRKPEAYTFDYISENQRIDGLELKMPGDYNIENAVGAISAVLAAGGNVEGIKTGLTTFMGIKRRFDVQYISENIVYIDDYAHHPEEIKAFLTSVMKLFPGREMLAIFQPHLYSRTKDFAAGFAEALSLADKVIVLDIYPAREKPIEGVDSGLIFDAIQSDKKAWCSKSDLRQTLESFRNKEQVILSVGAGDIDTEVEMIKSTVANW